MGADLFATAVLCDSGALMFASTWVSEMQAALILSFALCDLEITDAMCG
jgi:hypothetical protein